MVPGTSMTACRWRGQRSIYLGSLDQLLSTMMECTFLAVWKEGIVIIIMCNMINFHQKKFYYGDLCCIGEYFPLNFLYCNVVKFLSHKNFHKHVHSTIVEPLLIRTHPDCIAIPPIWKKISEIWLPLYNGQNVIAFEFLGKLLHSV